MTKKDDNLIMLPTVDLCFKELMNNPKVRIGFIAALLDIPPEQIKETTLQPTELRREYGEQKLGILDVNVLLQDGTQIDMEMQVAPFRYWDARGLFYLCGLFTGQLGKGDPYSQLKRCIHVSILDFIHFPEDTECCHRISLFDKTTGQRYTDLMELGSAFVPAVVCGEGDDTSLMEAGYGVLKDGSLLGYLEGEDARGLEILKSRAPAEVLTLELREGQVSAGVISASTVPTILLREEEPVGLELKCLVEVELTEYSRPLSKETREECTAFLEEKLLRRLESTLDRLQGWKADCVGLGIQAALFRPEMWNRAEDTWADWFSRLEPEIHVKVTVHE